MQVYRITNPFNGSSVNYKFSNEYDGQLTLEPGQTKDFSLREGEKLLWVYGFLTGEIADVYEPSTTNVPIKDMTPAPEIIPVKEKLKKKSAKRK